MVALLRFDDLKAYLGPYLAAHGFDTPMPVVMPGIPGSAQDMDAAPNRLVIVTIGGGPGLAVEYAIDQPLVQLRAVGNQRDYDDAEALALALDAAMLAYDHSAELNGKWCESIVRAGGSPQLLMRDDADRYHFTTSYVVKIESELDKVG